MLLDTDILIDVARNYPPAIAWLMGIGTVGLPGLVAMELLKGCRNLSVQRRVERQLQVYPYYWPTLADCQRAYQDFATYRLSHGLGLIDALIGATAVGCGETLATFNVKHYAVIAGLTTVQPY
jgi:predicted nucleic acid-binding protein